MKLVRSGDPILVNGPITWGPHDVQTDAAGNFVFHADVLRKLREAEISNYAENCDCSGERVIAARIDVLRKLP